MPTEDDILLKLVIQGMSPSDVDKLANTTQGELNNKMRVLLDQLTALHKGALDAQGAAMVTEITKETKLREQQLAQVKTVFDARAKEQTKADAAVQKAADIAAAAAKKQSDNEIKELQKSFDYAMRLATIKEKEDEKAAVRAKQLADDAATAAHRSKEIQIQAFEAITVAAEAAFEIIKGGFERFKELGEQIIKNAQIYGSLKGSIDSLREATHGEVADIDLITLKNRAFAKDLNLTDEQFALVAKQAQHFAHAIGVDTKEAMDQLVDGLATGRIKTLAHAGVVIDTTRAYEKFAEVQGLVVAAMTPEEKLLAVQTEALEKIKKKTTEFGEEGMTVARALEFAFAKVKNAITGTLAAIGNAKLSAAEDYGSGDLETARQDSIARGDPEIYKKALAVRAKARATREAAMKEAARAPYSDEELQAQQDQFFGGGEGLYGKPADTRTGADFQEAYKKRQEGLRKLAEEAKKAEAEFDSLNKTYRQFEKMLRGGDKGEGTPGLNVPVLTDAQRSHDLDTAYDSTGSRRASPGGLSGGLARQVALQKAFAGKGEREGVDVDRQQTQAGEAMAKVNEDAMQEIQDKADKLKERAGGGIFSQLMFGSDGPDKMVSDLDYFKGAAADTMGMVTGAAQQMADALGASLAALVSGSKATKGLRDMTHDILEALATQAYSKAIFETAEGLAMTGLMLFGDPAAGPSAAAHFAAAGMYATVGTAAALGARGVGHSSQSTGTGAGSRTGSALSSGGSGVSSPGSSSFGSGGMRSSGGSGGDGGTVVFNINAPLGDRAEIGRAVVLAASEYYAQSGRGIPLSPGSI